MKRFLGDGENILQRLGCLCYTKYVVCDITIITPISFSLIIPFVIPMYRYKRRKLLIVRYKWFFVVYGVVDYTFIRIKRKTIHSDSMSGLFYVEQRRGIGRWNSYVFF